MRRRAGSNAKPHVLGNQRGLLLVPKAETKPDTTVNLERFVSAYHNVAYHNFRQHLARDPRLREPDGAA